MGRAVTGRPRRTRGKGYCVPDTTSIQERLDGVIAAIHREGLWDVERPADSAFKDMGAFGINTMAFVQWLRWVFVPNVQSLIASDGPWPQASRVSAQATREGDTDPKIQALVPALRLFDELF